MQDKAERNGVCFEKHGSKTKYKNVWSTCVSMFAAEQANTNDGNHDGFGGTNGAACLTIILFV